MHKSLNDRNNNNIILATTTSIILNTKPQEQPPQKPKTNNKQETAENTKTKNEETQFISWWAFRIFFIFFRLGGGEGGICGDREGGGLEFCWSSYEGGGVSGEGRGGEGAGRVSAGEFWGGGLNIFFRGRNSHQDFCSLSTKKRPESSASPGSPVNEGRDKTLQKGIWNSYRAPCGRLIPKTSSWRPWFRNLCLRAKSGNTTFTGIFRVFEATTNAFNFVLSKTVCVTPTDDFGSGRGKNLAERPSWENHLVKKKV